MWSHMQDMKKEDIIRLQGILGFHWLSFQMMAIIRVPEGMPITSKLLSNGRLYIQIAEPESGIKGSIITFMLPNYDYVARHGEVVGKVKTSMLIELLTRAKTVF